MGLDVPQVRRWRTTTSSSKPPLPLHACVQSGWMVLPGGRWYGKLIPSSQICRSAGDPTLGELEKDVSRPVGRGRVLVVAFAASQAEPEWASQLGKLHWHRRHRAALISRDQRPQLADHMARMRALHPKILAGEEGLMASLWMDFNRAPDEFHGDQSQGEDELRVWRAKPL